MASYSAWSAATAFPWVPGVSSPAKPPAISLAVAKELNARGFAVACGILGEGVRSREEAIEAADQYCDLLQTFAQEGIDANVAFKTHARRAWISIRNSHLRMRTASPASPNNREHDATGHGAVALCRGDAEHLSPPVRAPFLRGVRFAIVLDAQYE